MLLAGRQEIGFRGDNWLTYRAYLLLDEAQVSYWDGELWFNLFKRIQSIEYYGSKPIIICVICKKIRVSHPFVILFSSYGYR